MSETIEDLTNGLLTFMHLCADERHSLAVSVKSMDGSIPTMGDVRSTSADQVLIPRNDGKPALWPIDVATVIDMNAFKWGKDEAWPDGTMQFQRIRTIPTKDARRLGASVFSTMMIMDEVVSAQPDGTTRSARAPYAYQRGMWVPAAPRSINYPPDRLGRIEIQLGWQLTVRYEWTIWLGYTTGPRIRFLSDPTGAREAFRLRDIPEGRSRRAALRNWVTAHWRQTRNDPTDAAWVRKHLRGAVDFTWNGMRCRIQPPDFDLEQLAEGRVP